MSSSVDSSYHASKAGDEKKKECPKGGSHVWKLRGGWPSTWEECEKCGKSIFWK